MSLLNTETFVSSELAAEVSAVEIIRNMYSHRFHVDCAARTRELLEVAAGKRYLDVGSSYGPDIAEFATEMRNQGELILLDKSRVALDLVKAPQGISVTKLQENCLRIPLAADAVDGVRAIRALQHCADPKGALSEMIRVLKPGGMVVVIEPEWRYKRITAEGPSEKVGNEVLAEQLGEIRHSLLSEKLAEWMMELGLLSVIRENRDFVTSEPQEVEFYSQIEKRLRRRLGAHADRNTEVTEALARYESARALRAVELRLRLVVIAGRRPFQ